jgi:hypothetical protein
MLLAGCTGNDETVSNAGTRSNTSTGPSSEIDSATSKPVADPPKFADLTEQTGIKFTYRNGEEAGHFSILESLGGGLAAVDFDLDGRDDLYIAGGGEFAPEESIVGLPGALFGNRGDWRFVDLTAPARAAAGSHYSHGVARADFDQDGFPDLLITGYGGVDLLHNLGDGTFESIAPEAGLNDTLWSSSAAWGDLNDDGHLDLYVAHYVDWSFDNHPFCPKDASSPDVREVCPPKSFRGLPDTLYFSNGDGTFRDVSAEVGLKTDGKGLGVLLADLDLDDDLDIYVTNDTVPSFLFRNDGGGAFTDRSLMSGTSLSHQAVPQGSMGVDMFDHNLDGLPDLWVVNYENETAALYQNEGDLSFTYVSHRMGINTVGSLFVGWGTCCFDVERDGDEDMFVSNGHVIRYPVKAPLRQTPHLFRNSPGNAFENVASAVGGYMSEPHMGRGASAADFDNDGDVDLAVSHTNEPVALLSNETDAQGGWLSVELIGTTSSRDAVGAVVRVITPQREFIRHWKGGGSYASTGSRRLFFGLGDAEQIEAVSILWPSGVEQRVESPKRDSLIHVVERAE